MSKESIEDLNKIQVFNYETNEFRTVMIDGEPWFVLKDVCQVLGLGSPHKVAERLDEDERKQIPLTDRLGRQQETSRPRNRIGFVMRDDSTPEFGREYRTDAGRYKQEDELSYRPGGASMTGYGSGTEMMPMTRETATEWVKHMENADGSHGPHWTMEKTEEARKQRNIQCDPLEFYVAMNMMYSDYVKAAEKINCSSMDFYAYMAKAFLDDKDAQPDKLARYYRYIVAH